MHPLATEITPDQRAAELKSAAARALCIGIAVTLGFSGVSVQLVRLALKGQAKVTIASVDVPRNMFSRPDIVDRNGRLLAADIAIPTLFADPSQIISVDETLEKLSLFYPGIDTRLNRLALSNRKRKYHQLKRPVAPAKAQHIHALGLPGIDFKQEVKRSYPAGRVAGHILGHVNGKNEGQTGIERFLNGNPGVTRVHAARVNTSAPLRLAVDMRALFGLQAELATAMEKFRAAAAVGIVVDVENGEIPAAASLPGVDPSNASEIVDRTRRNRLADDAFELGSVFKPFTLAMALETGVAQPGARINVAEPLKVGRFELKDPPRSKKWLSLSDVFVLSSNVGAAVLAQAVGRDRQRSFLAKLGLLAAINQADVKTTSPRVPRYWGAAETMTIAYGHGLAVAPLQFAVASAALVNGGYAITPTFLLRQHGEQSPRRPVLEPQTSAAIRKMMRRNVLHGTGRSADVPGYRVGGKTGTADVAGQQGYDGKSVVTSFLGAFPIDHPRYVLLVTLFDPMPEASKKERTAARNAAPTAGRIIARLAPILGVKPQ
ncbi:MAG: peptidoglycan D,D-transpeptidase FtsI family protein [Hyphomicrobiaceae bacterium]